jgi:hypothetical protein
VFFLVLISQPYRVSRIVATLEKDGEFMQALTWNDVQELLSL